MAIEGSIASAAQGEIPESWDALQRSSHYGDSFLQTKRDSVVMKLFGEMISSVVEAALDVRVIDYAGKVLALDLITPALDYWSKQPVSLGAQGQQEVKGWTDRSARLIDIRTWLLQETRMLWPDVEPLLPNRLTQAAASRPRVREIDPAFAHTPSPYDFEAPYAPSTRTPRSV